MSNYLSKLASQKATARRIVEAFKETGEIDKLPESYVSRAGITKMDLLEKVDKMAACCSTVRAKVYSDGEEKIISGNHCGNPNVCPICSKQLQSTRRGRFLPKVKRAIKNHRFIYKIVFTIPDMPDLYEAQEFLKQSMRRFRRAGQKRKNGFSGGEAGKWRAGIASMEKKRGSGSGLWHVHIHGLFFTDSEIDFRIYDNDRLNQLRQRYGNNIPADEMESAKLKAYCIEKPPQIPGGIPEKIYMSKLQFEWNRATMGQAINIHIEPVFKIPKNCPLEKKEYFESISYSDSVIEQCLEVLKYDFKFDSLENTADMLEAMAAGPGRCLFTFGDFRRADFDYIVENFKVYVNERNLSNRKLFAKWILENTDLRDCQGNIRRMLYLLGCLVRANLTQRQVEILSNDFKLDLKGLSEYEQPEENDGVPIYKYIYNQENEGYEPESETTSGLNRTIQNEINKIVGRYRSHRKRIFDENRDNPGLSKMLNARKYLMRLEISKAIERQPGLKEYKTPEQLAAELTSAKCRYYVTAF